MGNVSPDKSGLSVVSCDNIFKRLGEMPDSYIIFCYIQELLECYLLDNKQQTTINGLYLKLLSPIRIKQFMQGKGQEFGKGRGRNLIIPSLSINGFFKCLMRHAKPEQMVCQ